MGQASGMKLWINDHNKCTETVIISTDWVGMLVILDFLELDTVGYSDCQVNTTAKRATIRDAEYYKEGRTVSMSF